LGEGKKPNTSYEFGVPFQKAKETGLAYITETLMIYMESILDGKSSSLTRMAFSTLTRLKKPFSKEKGSQP
jgi:hypothetical protein